MEKGRYQIICKKVEGLHIGDQNITTESDPEKNEIIQISRTKLQNHYKRPSAYMRSLLKQSNYTVNDLPIKEYFVELKLREGPPHKPGKVLRLEEIFSKKDGHHTILLIGDPGYGKTTLCKKIAYDWASSDETVNYLNHYHIVVIIDLRELGEKPLHETILDTIFDNAKREKRPSLKTYKMNILFMIDGYDEFSDNRAIQKFINEQSAEISSNFTILITSRPQNVKSITQYMDLQVSIEGFSKENQEKYIRLIFEGKSSCCVNLLNHLSENAFLQSIAECPLMLNIICSLYQSEGIKLIKRLTDLYIRMLFQLTKRSKGNYGAGELTDTIIPGQDSLVRLVEAFPYPLNYQNRITPDTLNTCFPAAKDLKFILSLQLLHECSTFEDNYYDIIHETFHEFLSALRVRLDKNSELPHISNYVLLFMYGLCDDDILPKIPSNFNFEMFDSKSLDKLCIELSDENRQKFCNYIISNSLVEGEILHQIYQYISA